MKLLRLLVLVPGFFALASILGAADEKATNQEKLVGTWVVTKSAGGLPPDATVEFAKDGKLKINAKANNKSITIQGTYSVTDDKLTIALKVGKGEQKETMTIKTLTDKKLVTLDTNGKEDEFKKK